MKQNEFINCRFIQPVATDKKYIEPYYYNASIFSSPRFWLIYYDHLIFFLLYILLITFGARGYHYLSVCENDDKYIKNFKY